MRTGTAYALVLDTCGETGYVALIPISKEGYSAEPGRIADRRLGARATQEELLPAISAILVELGLSIASLAAIAVVSGPGSFTGVRIGLATAKGLCEAAGVPLITLSRLSVLAKTVEQRPAWVWLQAGRGEVYAEWFRESGQEAGPSHEQRSPELTGPFVLPIARGAALADSEWIVACEESLRGAAPGIHLVSLETFEQALRSVAADAFRTGQWADPQLSDALYLRVPDAELALRARQVSARQDSLNGATSS